MEDNKAYYAINKANDMAREFNRVSTDLVNNSYVINGWVERFKHEFFNASADVENRDSSIEDRITSITRKLGICKTDVLFVLEEINNYMDSLGEVTATLKLLDDGRRHNYDSEEVECADSCERLDVGF